MSRLNKCVYGGGSACTKQGGDGSLRHGVGYIHKYPTLKELDYSTIDKSLLAESEEIAVIDGELFQKAFDDSLAYKLLSLDLGTTITKSVYSFDLFSEDGVVKVLELLPIMDPKIVEDLASELWPGYAPQGKDPNLLRAEIKGYLLDHLKSLDTDEPSEDEDEEYEDDSAGEAESE